ncbi:8447_t:CDS:2 [Diversispora eburnea]|uniref:8447_t:CDS:1 n=1 Tax=Diversispora eburnea TaxID=1213867 RepID=A0A9N9BAD9_9GLOM|nr:8447_t:CDS:2 [Diversispora eburnea]
MTHEYIEMRTKWKGQDALYQEMDPISSNVFSSVIRSNSIDDDQPTDNTPLIPKPRIIHLNNNNNIINNSSSSSYDMITIILFIIVVIMGFTIWWCYSEDLYILYRIYVLNDINPIAVRFK